jgi:hypothetical protein
VSRVRTSDWWTRATRKLAALRETIQASLAEGGSFTDEEVAQAIEQRAAELA